MKVRLGSRSGRVVRQFAAEAHVPVSEEPLAAEAEAVEAEPEVELEPESAASRWDRLIAEIDEEEPVTAAIETAVVDLPSRGRRGKSGAILASAMSAITELAKAAALDDEPEEPQQIHVHFAAPNLNVRVDPPPAPKVEVNMPEIRQPDIHLSVEAPRAPNVEVNVPPPEAPRVDVHVPEQRQPDVHVHAAAPDVHVAAPEIRYAPPPVHVTVEQPRPSAVRLEIDDDGTRRFVPEEAEE